MSAYRDGGVKEGLSKLRSLGRPSGMIRKGALEWGSGRSEDSQEEPALFEEEKLHSGGKQVWPQCGKWEGQLEGSGAGCTWPAGQGERSGLYFT